MPHYVIGDVQGCYPQLEALLDKIAFNPAQDKLFFVGDLVNRGPDSLNTLRLIHAYSQKGCALTVLGNHDIHCLAVYFVDKKVKKGDTLEAVFASEECDTLMQWLRQQPLVLDIPQQQALIVHAGIPPQWDRATALARAAEVERQLQSDDVVPFLKHIYGNKPAKWDDSLKYMERYRYIVNAFTRMRFLKANGSLKLKEKGGWREASDTVIPWFDFPDRQELDRTVYFGHWAALNGDTHDNTSVVGLDTGCVWGGHLSAYCLETNLITRVR